MADKKVFSIQIDGIKQSVDGVESLGSAVNTNVSSIKELRTALKATKDEMAGLEKGTEQWQALAKVAGDYKDQIDDINQAASRFASDTKALDDAINIGQSMTSVFTLAQGAMNAFGLSTDGVVESIQKLQGAMAIIQSLQSLQNTLRGSTATTDLLSKSMKLMGLSMEGASKSTKLLRLGLASIGIGLIIGLVATLIEYWDDIKQSFMDTFPILKTLSERFNGLQGVIKGVGQAIVHWLTNPIVTFAKVIKKVFSGDFKGAIEEAKNGIINQFTGLKTAFFKGVKDSRKKVETEAEKTKKSVTKTAKETVDTTKKYLDDWVKAEKDANKIVDDERKKAYEAELKRLERLKKLRKDNTNAENDYQKQSLKLQLEYASTEEEKLEIKKKIIALDEKIAEQEAKNAAADAMGISVEELSKRLETTEATYVGLNDEQKQVLQTLITLVATIKMGAEEAMAALGGGGSTSGSTGDSGDTQNPLAKLFDNNIVQGFVDATLDSIAVIGDAIADLYDMELEEMEEKLDQLAELHDEAVEKVNESQDKISDLNQKMKDASGAQLEAYKQQMADEMLLLQQRQQEEKRAQKEKEKQEEAIKKKQKQARKDEMKVQLIESIVNTALAVTKTFSAYPMPFAAILGGIVSALGAIQQGIIIKQMSKLADGGLLQGKSHAQGGIPVGNTGVEVEGGEYVVNKRSTKKYLPLLQSINEEGARHKTVANQIGKMADGGELNYERINSNLDALSTASIVASAISGIDLHPVVSVVDINREQRNYTEVRQLAGASN